MLVSNLVEKERWSPSKKIKCNIDFILSLSRDRDKGHKKRESGGGWG